MTGDDLHRFYSFETYEAVGGPVWTATEGARRAICVTRGAKDVTLEATVRFDADVAQGTTLMLEAAATTSPLVFRARVIASSGSVVDVVLPRVSGAFVDAIGVEDVGFRWRTWLETAKGGISLAQTDPIVAYRVWSTPSVRLYDRALARACRYASGSEEVGQAICKGIADEILYTPRLQVKGGNVLDVFEDGHGDCNDHALLLEYLCNSIGVGARKLDVWGGSSSAMAYYRYEDGGLAGTLQLEAPEYDGVEENPHFIHHRLVEVDGGGIFDASYGRSGLEGVLETAAGAEHRVAFDRPQDSVESPWPCPHPAPSRVSSARATAEGIEGTRIALDPLDPGTLAEVDVVDVMGLVEPTATFLGDELRREGLAHRFALVDDRRLQLVIALHRDWEVANEMWRLQVDDFEVPLTEIDYSVGDSSAFWLPVGSGGSALFRRWNAVVLLSGFVSPTELLEWSATIDRILVSREPPVSPSEPRVPDIRALLPASLGAEPSEMRVRRSDRAIEIPLEVDPAYEGSPRLFSPDTTTCHLRIDPVPVLEFVPFRAGPERFSVVGVDPSQAVSSLFFRVEVTADGESSR